MKVFSLLEFVIQSIVATMGAFVLGAIGARLLSIVVGLLTRNSGPVNVVDYPVDQQVFRVLVDSPYFLAPITAAFVLGLFSNRVWKTNAGIWVWLFPAVFLVWNVFSWKSSTSRSNLADAWANYFGSDCDGSECLYEVLVTAPFYTSVAYSVGSIAMRVLGAARWSIGLGAMARRK
jgi:hypothetical protein